MKVERPALQAGDDVECAVTHEIVINGEKSWIKYGVTIKVYPDESPEAARARASKHVNSAVMQVVGETVETVRELT